MKTIQLLAITIYLIKFATHLNASDTLKLSQWRVYNEGLETPIAFNGAQNLLHVIRENQANEALKARFSEASRMFHDSIASLEHTARCTFDLSPQQVKAPSVRMEFNYLQTFCEIWLNRVLIGVTNNAFRTFTFSINRTLLREKNNELEIYFKPPREQILHSGVLPYFNYPADNQADSIKTAPFIRQPQQEFGWDFAFPEIYTGFRTCPELHFNETVSIRKLAVETQRIDSAGAAMRVKVKCYNLEKQQIFVHAKGDFGQSTKIPLKGEAAEIKFTHKNPALWWPRGSGNRPFYSLTVYLSNAQNKILDSIQTRYAIRSIQLIQAPDSIGTSFYFEVNGKPIYMQGANVVMPNEPFHKERLAGLSNKELDYVERSEMNMLRIWGGGTYLPDAFYNWADTAGILIWQDLMFACSYYPNNKEFEKNVMAEIEEQVFRLMHHPSLALICGNNEIDVARKNWGWSEKYAYSTEILNRLNLSYEQLFEILFSESIRSISTQLNYVPTSPISNWGKESDFESGDNHDWGIWHGELPFDALNKRIPRFMSEYGFPSFPPLRLLEQNLGIAAESIDAEQLVLSYKGLKLLIRYLDSKGYPHQNLAQLIQSSQELQMWHYRKMRMQLKNSKNRCMGDLWWQLNDVAPVMSWSLLDMEGNQKIR